VYKETLPTHTSLQINSSVLSLSSSKKLQIVDIPGHPRVRDQFQEHLQDAKALIFVVDASTVSRNGAAVAEYELVIPLQC
jgi:signal recognition particle receptor subunit beta